MLDAKESVLLDYKYDDIVFNNDIAIVNNGESYDLYDLTRKRITATIDDGIIKVYSSSFIGDLTKTKRKLIYVVGELIDSFERETIADCIKYYIVTSKVCMTDYGKGPCLFSIIIMKH